MKNLTTRRSLRDESFHIRGTLPSEQKEPRTPNSLLSIPVSIRLEICDSLTIVNYDDSDARRPQDGTQWTPSWTTAPSFSFYLEKPAFADKRNGTGKKTKE